MVGSQSSMGSGAGGGSIGVTEQRVKEILQDYVTIEDLETTLEGYVTNTALETTLASYATQTWVDQNYLSIAFFSALFQARTSQGAAVTPNSGDVTTIDNIKAMFGFWTDQYISALGQGSDGGGGGQGDVTWALLADNTDDRQIALSHLTSALTGYVTTSGLATTLASYVTTSALATTLADYVTATALATELADYVTTSALATALADYVTSSTLSTTLADYVTTSALSTTLADYVTATALSTTLASYATQTWVDQNYLSLSFFNALFQARTSQGAAVSPNAGDTTTIDNIKALFGFWTDQYISALGQGSDSGGGGQGDVTWALLADDTDTRQIALSHLTTALTGYATTSQLSNYVNNQGGRIFSAADTNVLNLDNAEGREVGIKLMRNGTEKGWFGYHDNGYMYIYNRARNNYLRYNDDGALTFEGYTVIHSGNISSYAVTSLAGYATTSWVGNNYLPLSGGTMTGNIYFIGSGGAYNSNGIIFKYNNTELSRIGGDLYGSIGLYSTAGIYLRPNVTLGTSSTNGLVITSSSFTYNEDNVLTAANSSVSLSDSTLSVKINGTTQSLTNTWRGIQDNLTSSTNTTESLSAKQGYLLANGSARDNTKLPLSGGTLSGDLFLYTASGNSPYLYFQRGGLTDATYTDYRLFVSDGDLIIQNDYATTTFGNVLVISDDADTMIFKNKQVLCVSDAASYSPAYAKVRSIKIGGTNYDFWSPASTTTVDIDSVIGNYYWADVKISTTSSTTTTPTFSSTYIYGGNNQIGSDGNGTNIWLRVGTKYVNFAATEGAFRRGTSSDSSTITLGTSTYPWAGLYSTSGNITGRFTVNGGCLNVTGEGDYAEGIRIHPVYGISSLWFGASGTTGYDAGMWAITVNSNGMRFRGTTSTSGTSPSDYMNILYGGNVGIGTTSPSYKLHVAGDIYATGGVTSLSDIRKKDVISYKLPLSVEQIANAPTIKFLWKDKREEGEQVGTIAQYWQDVLPESIKDKSGELSMSYGVAALISAITTARKIVDHEKRLDEQDALIREQGIKISELQKECTDLRKENEMLKLKIA